MAAPPTPGPNALRDHLANERTLLAWMRTGITLIGLGFVVAKFGILLREVSAASHNGHSHVHAFTTKAGAIVGVALVIAGIAAALLATLKFERIRRDIDQGIVRFSPALDFVLAVGIGVVGIVLAIYLVFTS
jgi:putative membrane protein